MHTYHTQVCVEREMGSKAHYLIQPPSIFCIKKEGTKQNFEDIHLILKSLPQFRIVLQLLTLSKFDSTVKIYI